MAQNESRLPVKATHSSKAPAHSPGRRSMSGLRREFDRLFDDLSRSFWPEPMRQMASVFDRLDHDGEVWMQDPAVDIVETKDRYEITAEIPGMDEKNIEVSFTGDALTIKGSKEEESRDDTAGHFVHERRYGAFERSFALPNNVNADKIDAQYAKGVLKITMPKTAESATTGKRIEVRVH